LEIGSAQYKRETPSMGHKEHKEKAKSSIKCFIITVSDTRTPQTDESGKVITELLKKNGHEITGYVILKDEPAVVREFVKNESLEEDVEVIIANGGTGISSRDSTFEAIDAALEKKLQGFGELFRYLSYKEIGSAAIMSRACAGVLNKKIIISIPGSENAVRLAMEKLILPEITHMVWEVKR
jgi:molybdenum cofactor biosynthesis protein B